MQRQRDPCFFFQTIHHIISNEFITYISYDICFLFRYILYTRLIYTIMHIAVSCPMWHYSCCVLPCSSADPRMSRLWRCHWFVASDHLHVCWQMNAGFSAGRTRKNASWAQVGQRCRGGQKSRIKIGRSNLFKPKHMLANVYCTKTATTFCFCYCLVHCAGSWTHCNQWSMDV